MSLLNVSTLTTEQIIGEDTSIGGSREKDLTQLHYLRPPSLVEVVAKILDQSSTLFIEVIPERRRTMSDRFKEVLNPSIMLKCNKIVSNLESYLRGKGITQTQYVLDVHELGEEQYVEEKPCVEVRLPIEKVGDLLQIWEEAIDFLEKVCTEEELDTVEIFFTRM